MSSSPKTIPKTIAIVAGEHSGDNCGAILIQALKKQYPDAKFIGIGGDKMIAEGLHSLFPIEKLSVIGFFNVLLKLPELINLKNNLIKKLIKNKIDLYIGIDSPDFNLSVANSLSKTILKNNPNFKIIHYVSPTVWAWRPRRIYKVARATDLLLCIFPFEPEIYNTKLLDHQKNNFSAVFVGHPLADILTCRTTNDQKNALNNIAKIIFDKSSFDQNSENLFNNKIIISIFPGSRSGEIKSLGKIFLEACYKIFVKNNNINFLVPIVSEKMFVLWQEVYNDYSSKTTEVNSGFNPGFNSAFYKAIFTIKLYELSNQTNSHEVMRASDLILCASGTTTLEAFLIGVPMVVAYKVSKLNELLLRLLIKVKYIAMPNILADRLYNHPIVPEFLQDNVTAENLSQAMESELEKNFNTDLINNNTDNINKLRLDLQNYLRLPNNLNHHDAMLKAIAEIVK